MFKYFPHTESDIKEMLDKIGVNNIDELFNVINPSVKYTNEFNIPSSHSEHELRKHISKLGDKNKQLISFLGAGSYDTFNFSVINALTSRQEFLTSYTPYQPEISQGTLQYIFEFQSMICELTGMDVTNASMYDGATATAEAMFMATSQTKNNKVLISGTLNPNVSSVVKTYAKYRGFEIVEIPAKDYSMDLDKLDELLDDKTACVIVGQPNFYGVVEDYSLLREKLNNTKALMIVNTDPSTLSVLKSPRELGADIACGDAQSLGIPLSFGGPYVGFLATTQKYLRKMPGRICGITNDVDGKRGFVLTLQAREQHIRREKANSNICSNQSLMALSVGIYMSLLGKNGLKEVALRAYNNSHYLEEELLKTNKFTKVTNQPFFKEFVLKFNSNAQKLNEMLLKHNFLGGLILEDNHILFCASEVRSKEEIDSFVRLVGDANV